MSDQERATFTVPGGPASGETAAEAPLEPGTLGTAGAPAVSAVASVQATVEERADAVDGSAAGRLRAKQRQLSRSTHEVGLPGWFNPETGEFDLVLEIKPIGDRKRLASNMRNEAFIVEATSRVLERDADGNLTPIPGGWQGMAHALGLGPAATLGQAVRCALGTVDDDGAFVESPLRVDALAQEIVAWMAGRRSQIEQVLGE